MKNKYFAILAAAAFCLWAGSGTAFSGEMEKGEAITKEAAVKKYPPPRGGYPTAEIGYSSGGVYKSPYPPYTTVDCRGINKGMLVVDPHVKKVFMLP